MILDASLQLSAAQAVTSTAVSTNTIDQGGQPPSYAKPLTMLISVDESAAAAGAATVTFQAISSASADLSSPTVLAQTDAIGKAELTVGRRVIAMKVPFTQWPTGHRYFGLRYLVGTGPLTAGKFTTYASNHDVSGDTARPFGSGFSVY